MISAFRTVELSDPSLSADGLAFATVKSRALGRRVDVAYHLPVVQGATDLPIVVLLHGVYGSHWAWALKGGALRTAARLTAEGALPPVALLMPSDGLWGDGSGYVRHDGDGDGDAERWIMDEVPALARELTTACAPSSPLLLAGLSMGGFAALRLAGKYRQRVAAAAGLSSVTTAAQLDGLLEESRSHWSRAAVDQSVLAALTEGAGPLPPLWFECGVDDPFIDANRSLHAQLQRTGIVHHCAEGAGGHDWNYWSGGLARVLGWFGEILRQPREVA